MTGGALEGFEILNVTGATNFSNAVTLDGIELNAAGVSLAASAVLDTPNFPLIFIDGNLGSEWFQAQPKWEIPANGINSGDLALWQGAVQRRVACGHERGGAGTGGVRKLDSGIPLFCSMGGIARCGVVENFLAFAARKHIMGCRQP